MATKLVEDPARLSAADDGARLRQLQSAHEEYQRLVSVQQLIATVKLRHDPEPHWLQIVRGLL